MGGRGSAKAEPADDTSPQQQQQPCATATPAPTDACKRRRAGGAEPTERPRRAAARRAAAAVKAEAAEAAPYGSDAEPDDDDDVDAADDDDSVDDSACARRPAKAPRRRRPSAAAAAAAAHRSGPSAEECWAVRDALASLHGEPDKPHGTACGGDRRSVLDALVGTILSQNTTDLTSARAFAKLKRALPDWDAVRTADPAVVEDAIREGGLAEVKTARVQAILRSVFEERGETSLEHLRDEPDAEVKRKLLAYNGVGPKTVSCVMMFTLGRAEFPVDTHVWKIAKTLGWVPQKFSRNETYDLLNECVPPGCKYDLHVLLVEHGKAYKNDVAELRRAVRETAARRAVEPEAELKVKPPPPPLKVKPERATPARAAAAAAALEVKAEVP